MNYTIDELDVTIELNIQVKQHTNNASIEGVFQIAKNLITNDTTLSRNILVTSGLVDEAFKKDALNEHNVYVYGPDDIARMILENFSEISSTYLSKLNIVNKLVLLE